MEVIRYSGLPTTISLLFNAVFCLLLLTVFNILLNKTVPRLSLSQGELSVIYVMICISSTIGGHGFMQVLIPIISHPFWFATPENEWSELFLNHMPDWLVVSDNQALKGYYNGEVSFYYVEYIKAWLQPIISWSLFIIALVLGMLGINIIIRRQWTENEKLAYPVIQLPLEMVGESNRFFKNRFMWIGFAIAGIPNIINGLHYFFPNIPYIPIKRQNIGHYFTEKPWNAVGWLPISFYPFAIGLGFFMPLDLSFSCWFFYLFWKGENILGSVLGLKSLPNFPYPDEQSWGAYMMLVIFAFFLGRKYFIWVFRSVFSRQENNNESKEPIKYRSALLLILCCLIFLILFCHRSGMSIFISLMFFVIYYALSTAITRMRIELGSPVHDIHWIGSDEVLVRFLGTRSLGTMNLINFTFLRFFNRAQYSHTMPQQLEGFKIAEKMQTPNRQLFAAMVIAILIAPFATFWTYLHIMYNHGATQSFFGAESFSRLQRWLNYPEPTNYPALAFMGVGLLFSLFLFLMRMKFVWWPFHPAGYAVSGSWSMNNIWLCLFISWLAKKIILKYGGLKAHLKATPLFMGLILGEFTIGSIWTIIGISLDMPTYGFWF
ncbi:hypothetical protein GF312_05600 [Candidatus Poribacteria bacterium]|nr:hypothetical protein [Candidatus Poribacteria bacterium]